jgi:hypothetical protein
VKIPVLVSDNQGIVYMSYELPAMEAIDAGGGQNGQ